MEFEVDFNKENHPKEVFESISEKLKEVGVKKEYEFVLN